MEFVRGDSFLFKFLIKLADNSIIEKVNIKSLYITVRLRATKESDILFQKTLDDVNIDEKGYCHAEFLPEDTENLPCGEYWADIEITTANGYKKTRCFKFSLLKETTIFESGGLNGI